MESKHDFSGKAQQERMLIPQLSSQTGDTIHVAAALALYEEMDVIVVHFGAVGTCQPLLDFYRRAAKETKERVRVKVVYTLDEKASYKISSALTNKEERLRSVLNGLLDVSVPVLIFADPDAKPPVASAEPEPKPEQITSAEQFINLYLKPAKYTVLRGVSGATTEIANKFKTDITDTNRTDRLKKIYTKLTTRLSDPSLKVEEIIGKEKDHPTFAGERLPNAGPVALLWARYSGTNSLTEYNPEGDSSVQGQEELLVLLKGMGFNVITIGHGPRGGNPVKSEFHVGEFYLQPPITADRASQTSFFLALMETYPGNLFQIGQKTGAMDCAALIGVPTLYLEHKGSHSIARMRQWVDNVQFYKVPFYRDFEIKLPPSRIGASLCEAAHEFAEKYEIGKTEQQWRPRPSPKTRLACMIYKYPAEMDVSEVDKVDEAHKKDKVIQWIGTELAEEDLGPNGKLAKRIQTTNLSLEGAGPVGYTDDDLIKIKAKMEQLQKDYSAETTIIRTADGSYETRQIKL